MEIDYKEKYMLAMERAKNFIENGDERERTIAESIFAGLMEESEDERIRKYILSHFQGHLNKVREFISEGMPSPFSGEEIKMLDASVAWLEKQKYEEWSLYDEKILSEVFVSVETDNAYSEGKKKKLFHGFKNIVHICLKSKVKMEQKGIMEKFPIPLGVKRTK